MGILLDFPVLRVYRRHAGWSGNGHFPYDDGNSGDSGRYSDPAGLYSINLRIMGNKANVALVTDKYDVLVSMRYLKNVVFYKNTLFV